MTIDAITSISQVAGTGYLAQVDQPAAVTGTGFENALTGAIDNAQALQGESSTLAMQAITGDLNDIHAATIASTRAAVTLELVAAVRNKGVDAFNEILRMQA
ncbi:flagellar hook-basal body complex protein FliE [Agromyces humi]|uniref:flagellar hook-basal body complex protein FliE n=1 Tax=Agromyces humi TaxID=1766800 RepID=UPI0013592956|nr:flagellar hook-basal body complex protein FliE [Agromyces humi]